MAPPELPADVPKTDRELLLQVHNDVKSIKSCLDGADGKKGLSKRVEDLENWRWYIIGAISLATFALVAFGRYIDLTR